jgi:hypothetical protein
LNILLIGNGFDLAHHLPTKYPDFLEFVKVIKQILKICNGEDMGDIDWGNINVQVKELIKPNMGNVRNNLFSQSEMWNDLIGNNVWIEYFLQCDSFLKENWIDFESEISRIIKIIDNDIHRNGGLDTVVRNISEDFFANYFLDNLDERIQMRDEAAFNKYAGLPVGEQSKYAEQYRQDNPVEPLKEEITYGNLISILEDDLNKLIRALEIYICEYVEKIDIIEKSPNIDKEEIDFILSFNYTHIFSKLYNVSSQSKKEIADPFDYLHGEAKINNTIETNNMVLGIDEYLSQKRRNKETEFIAFKKFYQRIYKQTGSEYKRWIEIIKNQIQEIDDKIKKQYPVQIPYNKIPNKCRNQLFIFGHSLDITDKDVLREMILNDNVYTTIYYPDKKELGRKIANLVKVIGQDELIRRTVCK